MTKELLVPLRSADLLKEILPYVRDLAQPGMTVVFLVHFSVNRFKQLTAQLLMINSGLPANFDADAVAPESGAAGLSNVEQKIQRAAEQLLERGVTIKVKFYTGSLRRLVGQCTEN